MAGDQVIAGRYELGERLGFGGMSTVQLAFDRRLEREVAVKLLAEHLADDPQFVSRFRREALAAAQLVHPNIVQVFDFGLDDRSGRHYIVMEYIRGKSGAELLRDHGRLRVEDALFIVNQACRGLEHAHRHGVVHRDVKPGNLLRSDDGVVKLADFGIAKATSDSISRITQVGSVLGTAAYLAPEQAAGEEANARSDLYALGVVTYQLLAGRLPYEAQSLTELALKQQREVPPRLDELDPAIPEGVAQAVDRALELDPAERYASADELREALSAGAAGATFDDERTARTSVVADDETLATRIAAGPATEQSRRARRLQPTPGPAPYQPAGAEAAAIDHGPSRGRRALATFLLLALIAASAIGLYLALTAGGDEVQLREVTFDNVPESVDAMKELVDSNTR
ncbi:MAG: protein kinase [Actinomycetota bacterium]|nr:protein kinase [Actinomycetota bacterium]